MKRLEIITHGFNVTRLVAYHFYFFFFVVGFALVSTFFETDFFVGAFLTMGLLTG